MGWVQFYLWGMGGMWDVAMKDVLTRCVGESFCGGTRVSRPFKGVGGGWGGLSVWLDGYGGGVQDLSDSGDRKAACFRGGILAEKGDEGGGPEVCV